jgi:hypothetical protein
LLQDSILLSLSFPDSILSLLSPLFCCSSAALVLLQSWKTRRHQLENNESKKLFFLFPDNLFNPQDTDSAADPMNCLFSNSLLEDPAAAAAVSFDVTGAVGSYVITPNLSQCDPSTNSYVNYGGMASSSESVGVAYDSITNQIYLTDARK